MHWGPTESGFFYASANISASEHGGTHLDAPVHFADGSWSTDEIPLEHLIGPAVVIDISSACAKNPDYVLSVRDIRVWEEAHGTIPEGAIVLLRSGWEERWPDRKRYLGDDRPGRTDDLHFPGFSEEAAEFLCRTRGVHGVGLDTASLDPGNSTRFEAHQVFGAANVYGLENLKNLDELPARGATLIAMPMKIEGGTGGPTRVLALIPR